MPVKVPKSEVGPAVFSDERPPRYRYTLTRVWDDSLPTVAFIGLNPSTADETKLDPTLRRCLRYSYDWDYGSFVMVNLFAFRATDPLDMKAQTHPVGPDNDRWLREVTQNARLVVACWGGHGSHMGRADIVRIYLREWGVKTHCLRMGATGEPWHPLYLPSDLKPKEMEL